MYKFSSKGIRLHPLKYPKYNMPHTRSIKLAGYNRKVNINADIAKKSIDIFSYALQVFGTSSKKIKAHTPLLSLLLTLLGFFVSALGALLDKNNSYLKKIATVFFLVLMALASIAIFLLATTNPITAITISIILILTDILLTTIKLIASCFQFFKHGYEAKEKITTSQKNIPETLLKAEKKDLENQLDSAIYTYNLLTQSKSNKQPDPVSKQSLRKTKADIKKIQHKMLIIDKKLFQVQNKQQVLNKQLKESKRELFEDSFDFLITVGSNITTLIGILLTIINPLLGICLILLGFTFDILELSGHIAAKFNEYQEVKKLSSQQKNQKSYYLIDSLIRLKKQNKEYIKKKADIINELKGQHVTAVQNREKNINPHNKLGFHNHNFHSSAIKAVKNKDLPRLIPQI